ncbi:cyclophilin-like fold protein [uncultured Akkermansia sp.]|uniref:cyclophilin-like fold protein n=1 Tax=uncultured Akkermansia sp. TaxID=512294 RepID=UPI00265CFFC7|nr:cyclophilin-like fold protein [uncultured Akkermansia sp.]
MSTDGAPAMGEPFRGAIAYYAPWGNLCIFRKDFRPSGGLVIPGSVDGEGLKFLDVPGKFRVTIDVKR